MINFTFYSDIAVAAIRFACMLALLGSESRIVSQVMFVLFTIDVLREWHYFQEWRRDCNDANDLQLGDLPQIPLGVAPDHVAAAYHYWQCALADGLEVDYVL